MQEILALEGLEAEVSVGILRPTGHAVKPGGLQTISKETLGVTMRVLEFNCHIINPTTLVLPEANISYLFL